MKSFLLKNHFLHLTFVLFVIFTAWWISVKPFDPGVLTEQKGTWSMFYWFFAAFGGLFGIFASRELGFWRSVIGKVMFCFSLGLLLQALGQIIDSYLSATGNAEIFYPSIAELGYSSSILAYIYGSYLLARYIGISPTVKNIAKSVIVWLVPIAMFALSYLTYLKGYDFANNTTVHVIFDFGYPILQSIYVALAVFVLIHSKSIQGGALRKPIAFLVVALIFQYVADSYFVYQFNRGVWYSANFNDYCYLLAYFILAVSIIYIDEVIRSIHTNNEGLAKDAGPELQNSQELNTTYINLLKAIIKSQEEVIGPLAWTEVSQVKNIIIKNKDKFDLEISENPKETINALLEKFFKVFGPTALYVAKRNTYRITKNMQLHDVPDKLL